MGLVNLHYIDNICNMFINYWATLFPLKFPIKIVVLNQHTANLHNSTIYNGGKMFIGKISPYFKREHVGNIFFIYFFFFPTLSTPKTKNSLLPQDLFMGYYRACIFFSKIYAHRYYLLLRLEIMPLLWQKAELYH